MKKLIRYRRRYRGHCWVLCFAVVARGHSLPEASDTPPHPFAIFYLIGYKAAPKKSPNNAVLIERSGIPRASGLNTGAENEGDA